MNVLSNIIGAAKLGVGSQAETGESVTELWCRERHWRYSDIQKGIDSTSQVGRILGRMNHLKITIIIFPRAAKKQNIPNLHPNAYGTA